MAPTRSSGWSSFSALRSTPSPTTMLEDACRQKGKEFGMATRQFAQFVVLRKIIDGKRADFDGFLSNLGFAKVGAPPPQARCRGAGV
ncbi:unnamed protein product [Miscanthus lutarioriparius]|uniref:Uncharacterized protein n=1 Tax=Miscanthus lutarioriparius TaxID=422564 RepID=A0A811QJK1_9POAL|nr:unnamed protein product [Miscanthus lutarioriparius]